MNTGDQYEIKSHNEIDLIAVVDGNIKVKYSYANDKLMAFEDDILTNGYIDTNYWKTNKKHIHKITANSKTEILFVPYITYDSIINVITYLGILLFRPDNCQLHNRVHPVPGK